MQCKFNILYLNLTFQKYRVGKTSLVKLYVEKKFTLKYKSTIGADFLTKGLNIDGNEILLQIWDTSGYERFHHMGASFYRNTECCALVFDLTDSKSFENIESWRTEFLNQLNPEDPDNFPFVLIGNKSDKVAERKVEDFKINQYCQTKSIMSYFETSCKNNINVDAAFEEVAKLAFKRASKGDEIFFKNELDKNIKNTSKEDEKINPEPNKSDLSLDNLINKENNLSNNDKAEEIIGNDLNDKSIIKKQEKEINRLKEEVEKYKAECDKLKIENEILKNNNENWIKQLSKANKIIRELQENQNGIDDLKKIKDENANLKNQLSIKDNEINNLRAELQKNIKGEQ